VHGGPGVAHAAPPSPCDVPVAAKHSVVALRSAAAAGVISGAQADGAVRRCLDQLAVAGHRAIEVEVAATPDAPPAPELTALQRFAGLLTFVNVLWTLAVVVGVAAFAYLFGSYVQVLRQMLGVLPRVSYTVVVYALTVGAYWWAVSAAAPARPYIALCVGCLGQDHRPHDRRNVSTAATRRCW
jgi:hypothetical protein